VQRASRKAVFFSNSISSFLVLNDSGSEKGSLHALKAHDTEHRPRNVIANFADSYT